MNIIFTLVFLFTGIFGTYFYDQNFVGLWLISLIILRYLFEKLGYYLIVLPFIFLNPIFSIFYFNNNLLINGTGDHHTISFIQSLQAQGLVNFLLIFLGVFIIPWKRFNLAFKQLYYVGAIQSLFIFYNYLSGQGNIGINRNSSLDGALVACLLPFYCYIKNKYLSVIYLILITVATFVCNGSVGVGCLVAGFTFICWDKVSMKIKLLIPIVLSLIAYLIVGKDLFHHSGRFPVYIESMKFLFNSDRVLNGFGISSYWYYGPIIQEKLLSMKNGYFTIMHSDFLQFFFEFGVVAGVALIISLIAIVRRTIILKNLHLTAAIASYFIFALFYYPCHVTLTAILGMFIFRKAIGEGYEETTYRLAKDANTKGR